MLLALNLVHRAQRLLRLGARDRHPIALAMLDIDHFKQVNDDYGHPIGDRVLRAIAERLAAKRAGRARSIAHEAERI